VVGNVADCTRIIPAQPDNSANGIALIFLIIFLFPCFVSMSPYRLFFALLQEVYLWKKPINKICLIEFFRLTG
jgi:hypothetical protein